MVATGLILCMTVIAESWLNESDYGVLKDHSHHSGGPFGAVRHRRNPICQSSLP